MDVHTQIQRSLAHGIPNTVLALLCVWFFGWPANVRAEADGDLAPWGVPDGTFVILQMVDTGTLFDYGDTTLDDNIE